MKLEWVKDKQTWLIIGLLLAGCLITATVLFIRYRRRHTMNKGIQQSTIDFLKDREGVRNDVYNDVSGVDTVGVGHVVLPNEGLNVGDVISNAEVDSLLKSDLKKAADQIKSDVKAPLNQNQFDALVSLVFNIGIGAFHKSTLLKYINEAKGEDFIETAWLAWKYDNGVMIKELLHRREKEFNLYTS
jgi:lysozyme